MCSKSSQSSCGRLGRNRILIHADIRDKDRVTVCVASSIPGLESQACSQMWRTQGRVKIEFIRIEFNQKEFFFFYKNVWHPMSYQRNFLSVLFSFNSDAPRFQRWLIFQRAESFAFVKAVLQHDGMKSKTA